MSCDDTSNFYVVARPVTDLVIGNAAQVAQGFETNPVEHIIGEIPGIGEMIIGGN